MPPDDALTASPKLVPMEWLPPDLYAAIGMVVQQHAYLETMLQHTIYDILGLSDVEGRIAVREPRTSERLAMIVDLAALKELVLDADLINKLKSDLPKAASLRDGLAHGMFFEHPETGEAMIREMHGTWQPPGAARGSVKKRIVPPASHARADNIAQLAAVIHAMVQGCRELRDRVRTQLQ